VLQRLRSRFNREEGFTLIELLVVILIIGILAAIAIPSFLNQRGKGEDASAKANVKTAQTAWETYRTDEGDYNCGATCLADLQAIENTIPDTGVALTAAPAAGIAYRIVGTGGDGRTYTLERNTDGSVSRNCAVPPGETNRGGCPTAGTW
jgi:type IV pilus assembly protein PilA